MLVGVAAVSVAMLPKGGRTDEPTLSGVSAKAGFQVHSLKNATLESASFRPAGGSKPPMPGAAGAVLFYRYRGQDVGVYEFRDPDRAAPLLLDSMSATPPTFTVISGVSCAVWTAADGFSLMQLAFKTSDGLVIVVQSLPGFDPTAAQHVVSELTH